MLTICKKCKFCLANNSKFCNWICKCPELQRMKTNYITGDKQKLVIQCFSTNKDGNCRGFELKG
jgi:hypothetical protein